MWSEERETIGACEGKRERREWRLNDTLHKAEEEREGREGRDERTETKRSKHGEEAGWAELGWAELGF